MRTRLGPLIGLAALVMLLTIVLPARPAGACTCVGSPEDELVGLADAIFTGRLLDRREPDNSDPGSTSGDLASLRFEVDAVHKGEVAVDQVVVTAQGTASCGLGITGEGPFLVFADRTDMAGEEVPDGMLHAISCGGTRPLAAGPLPPMFGSAYPPNPPADGSQPSRTAPLLATDAGSDDGISPLTFGVMAGAGGLLGGVAAFFLNRRRARRASA